MVSISHYALLLLFFRQARTLGTGNSSCPSLEGQTSLTGFGNPCVNDTGCGNRAKCCPTKNGSRCWHPSEETDSTHEQHLSPFSRGLRNPMGFQSSMTVCPDGSNFLKHCYMKTCPDGYYCYFGICCRHTKRGLCPVRFDGGKPHGPQCDNDVECPTIMKCCSIADGWFCVYPRDFTDGTVNAEKGMTSDKAAPPALSGKAFPPVAPNAFPYSEFTHESSQPGPMDQSIFRQPVPMDQSSIRQPMLMDQSLIRQPMPVGNDLPRFSGNPLQQRQLAPNVGLPYGPVLPPAMTGTSMTGYGYGYGGLPMSPFLSRPAVPYAGYPRPVSPYMSSLGPLPTVPAVPYVWPMPSAPYSFGMGMPATEMLGTVGYQPTGYVVLGDEASAVYP